MSSNDATRRAHRKWYAKNKARRAEYNRAWRAAHPTYNKTWYEKHPERLVAKEAVHAAVRYGRMERQPCQCGSPADEAHHVDYTKPLDVVWMCRPCHAETRRVDA